MQRINDKSKLKWVKKNNAVCLVAHATLTAMDEFLWHLVSAGSRHMLGDKILFNEIELTKGVTITFEDGNKSTIEGKGKYQNFRTTCISKCFICQWT